MTIQEPGVRLHVISLEARAILFEMLQFRHFSRYYYDLEYDWDRLEFLWKKFTDLQPILARDLDAFEKFLESLRG